VLLPTLRLRLPVLSIAILAATIILSGCHNKEHPDDRMAVYNTLDKNYLRSVTVSQDRGKGTITLNGIVGSMATRQMAEKLAQQAAPEYQILNRLQVQSTGLQDDIQAATQKQQLDSSIEQNFKAMIADVPSLKSEKIQYTAFHGTLMLKGTVRSRKEREQAEDLAKRIPQVQHVDNQLQIRPGKPSPASS
jgi:osmotically-inducible protein OsmY